MSEESEAKTHEHKSEHTEEKKAQNVCFFSKQVLQKELLALVGFTLFLIVVLKIVFFKESFASTIKVGLAFVWTSLIPGLCVVQVWRKHLSTLERFALGMVISFSLVGGLGYYLGLVEVNVNSLTIILPIAVSLIGLCAVWFCERKHKQ